MPSLLLCIFRERCPYCGKGKVYKKKKFFLQFPKMNDNCPNCGRDFVGEPGYYFGAMYVSYAIAVAFGIATFIACRVFGVKSFDIYVAAIVGVIVSIFYKNFKWSRIIWLKIFPPGEGTNFIGGGNKKMK
jgi:uncharacterized protein (DUF983 family)